MRIYVIKLILLALLFGILGRLFYWQIVRAEDLQAKAEGQHFENLKIEAHRGDILFSDGFVLASSKPTYLLYGLPKVISDFQKAKLAETVAGILAKQDQDKDALRVDLVKKLSEDLFWVALVKNIDLEDKKKIESLKLEGIGFEEGNNRFYAEASSAAHLLGFVASDAKGESTGYFGLEGYYNGELKGISGNLRQEKDAFGLPILIGKFLSKGGTNGKDLRLNIDRAVQFAVEQNLKKGLEKYGAKAASAVVMDPKTGDILALASFPNYDPANFEKFPKELLRNPVVADSYEPGSTFKVLTMSAAIDQGAVTPDTRCDNCDGPISLGGFSIKTWNDKYFPQTTMTEGIIHSDNTAMVFTSRKLGLDKFYSYLQNFGLGEATNIDLQDESSPDLRAKKDWREIDLATASFGQGIAITPIQMITAVAAIANGGNLMEPHVVREIKDENGSFEIKPKLVRKVIKEETAKIITEMMVRAVDEGEAKFAKPRGFRIAGKTGTAQIPVAGHYDPHKTIASFVGFAPADNPKFVMLVRYDQPSASIFGSETAAPTWFDIASDLFTYFKVAPTEE